MLGRALVVAGGFAIRWFRDGKEDHGFAERWFVISLDSWSGADDHVSCRPSDSVRASRITGVFVFGLFLEKGVEDEA
jgi:hypothetical protein